MRSLPAPFDRYLTAETLHRDPASVCLLDVSGRIVFVNAAWDAFARENGGDAPPVAERVLGTRWTDGMAGRETKVLFAGYLEKVLGRHDGTCQSVRFDGECNSSTTFRALHSTLNPVGVGDDGQGSGVLSLNVIVAERPIADVYELHPPDERRYRTADGLLVSCSSCRRTRVAAPVGAKRRADSFPWEMVPQYVAALPPNVSYAFCPTCLESYYGIGMT